MNPDLKFKINKGLDEWACREFLTFRYDDIFSHSILKGHPNLKHLKGLEKEEFIQSIRNYVNDYYKKYSKQIYHVKNDVEKDWRGVSAKFFYEVNKVFKNFQWSKEGSYTCYLSIFNCNPRFLKEKEFQAFYKHSSGVIYVCAHEMLHFIFYDYIKLKYPNDYESLGENWLWKLSEIFNDIILRSSEFIEITGEKNPDIYAENEEELNRYMNIWYKTENIDDFLKESF